VTLVPRETQVHKEIQVLVTLVLKVILVHREIQVL
jgi:hypothetical protein